MQLKKWTSGKDILARGCCSIRAVYPGKLHILNCWSLCNNEEIKIANDKSPGCLAEKNLHGKKYFVSSICE